MPRNSRHKSHKQSKHSSKEAKDCYSDSEEDVKMKEKEKNNSKEEGGVRVSKDSSHSASGEKRKLSSSLQLKEGKDGKDLSGYGNGDASEDYVSSKRRKDKVEGGSDRWNGAGDEKGDAADIQKDVKGECLGIDLEKGFKSRESKGSGDSKSKSSKRHEIGGAKEEKNFGLVVEKEENRSGNSRGESKRKSEKDPWRKEGKESKEVKEKERGSDGNRKGQESKQELEVRSGDADVAKKPGLQSEDVSQDRQSKRGRENTELAVQDEFRNPELEKELEKRMRKRRESSGDRDRYQDVRESDDRHIASRGDRAKDAKCKDERYKDASCGDKYHDNVEKDDRPRDEKHREVAEKDIKHREDGERDSRRREDKYHEDGERENRRREDKYSEDGDKEDRRRDDKYREDGERDGRRRDDKHREYSERENKRRDDKYREDGYKDSRRDDRYYEDGEKDDRHRDDKYTEDGDRLKEEKHRGDYESRHRDSKQGDGIDREKRLKGAKYRDERSSKDRSGDKSDAKHLREDSHASELQHARKSSRCESSPTYDDRARLKDDQGRKRTSGKEDYSDTKSRSTKDQRHDAEKRSASSTVVDLVNDRGRSTSRNADLELTPNRNRHQTSPSSSSHYRVSKQEESKYREYAYEERARHSVSSTREYGSATGLTDKISVSRSMEKVVLKDDSYLGELSAERHLKSDIRASPRQLVDKSPSSTSTDRRRFSRSDVRRSIDVEESGQRSGVSKEAKEYSGKEGRGSRDLGMEALVGDDLSQGDGDTLSVSSPFARTGHLSSSSKSLLPPPFRTGVDSSLPFGSSEDDSRMKFNNRHRRISDPNMGRVQGSPWRNVPNWSSPVANGFIPFQHGPPPVGFHQVMQQFPAPPIFGVRRSMELNHPGMPYHIPDADRFTGHVRPMGWRNPMDDSCPPPLQGWDANNSAFNEESQIYGRPGWDHGRNLPSGRGWEMSGDIWKGPKTDASLELQPVSDKERHLTCLIDEASTGQSVPHAKTEQIQPDSFAESLDTSQSSDALEKKTPEDSNAIPQETIKAPKMSQKDDVHFSHVYLSMLDISADLTDPELYRKCIALVDADGKRISDSEDSKILYVEEISEVREKNPSKYSSAPIFSTINDSLFQRAMMIYKNQRENFSITSADNVSFSSFQNMGILKSDQVKQSSDDNKTEELVSDGVQRQPEDIYSNFNEEVKLPVSLQKLGDVPSDACQKLDKPVISGIVEKSEEIVITVSMKEEIDCDPEMQDRLLENSVCMENMEPSDAYLPTKIEVDILPSNSMGNQSPTVTEEEMLPDAKYGSLLLSDVSSKACEIVMPESIESESVNLSRIHHSPESTH